MERDPVANSSSPATTGHPGTWSERRACWAIRVDGSLVTHADLSGVSAKPWNDIVVDDRGNAYVNTIGFDFPGGEFAPGLVVPTTPDGNVRRVAGDVLVDDLAQSATGTPSWSANLGRRRFPFTDLAAP